MIYFITKSKKTYTLLTFLNTWGGDLRKTIKILPFEKMVRAKNFYPGTYILTDYDLLSDNQTLLLKTIYDEFNQKPEQFKLLNQPLISLSRLQLLSKLHNKKVNDFRCFTSTQMPDDIHFPVFVRKGKDHSGKITELLNNSVELNQTIKKTVAEGFNKSEILITEFVETSDNKNIFRKYSAFIVGNMIIPRHIFFNKKWMVKGAALANDYMINEEIEYLKSNPHEKQLREIFTLAGINYGRIDYGIKNNKISVWEINSNPMIASSSSLKKKKRKAGHNLFVSFFIAAFEKINVPENRQALLNPIYSQNEIQQLFPFNPLIYWLSNFYQNIKSILLFQFYSFKNKLINKKWKELKSEK